MKKIKSLLLAIVMLMSMLLPITVQAEQVRYCDYHGTTIRVPIDIYAGPCTIIICGAPKYKCRVCKVAYCVNGHLNNG